MFSLLNMCYVIYHHKIMLNFCENELNESSILSRGLGCHTDGIYNVSMFPGKIYIFNFIFNVHYKALDKRL